MNPPTLKSHFKFLYQIFSEWGFSWGGLFDNRRGEWLLITQLLIITAHLFPAWPSTKTISFTLALPITIAGLAMFIIGIILAGRAFLQLGPSLSPLPAPKPGAALVINGAYSYCRHPLYQALLISSAGITIYLGSLLHLLLFIILCILLRNKAKWEESKLKEIHPEYIEYLAKTPALLKGLPLLDWRD